MTPELGMLFTGSIIAAMACGPKFQMSIGALWTICGIVILLVKA